MANTCELKDNTMLGDSLARAGHALIDAAMVAATTEGQTAAFDAATAVADQLAEVGRVVAAGEIRQRISDF